MVSVSNPSGSAPEGGERDCAGLPLRADAWPETLQLAPTNACNLRCSQCPKTWHETDNRHMRPEVYRRVREQILPHVREVHLQGLGEPMLSPLFGAMLDDAERLGLRIHFVTNSHFLDEGMAARLVRAGADATISIDGACEETHQWSRPGNALALVTRALDALLAERRRQPESRFTLRVNTVVTTKNAGELLAILELCGRYGAISLQLINPGVGKREDEFARAAIGNHPELLREQIPRLRARAKELGVELQIPEYFWPRPPEPAAGGAAGACAAGLLSFLGAQRLFPGVCRDPWRMVYVDVDGWVRPCCRALWVGMGNLIYEPFESLWNNEVYRALRASIHSDNPPAFCRDCTLGWGITCGDERFVEKLEARGIHLPPPPRIWRYYPEHPEVAPPDPPDIHAAGTTRSTPERRRRLSE